MSSVKISINIPSEMRWAMENKKHRALELKRAGRNAEARELIREVSAMAVEARRLRTIDVRTVPLPPPPPTAEELEARAVAVESAAARTGSNVGSARRLAARMRAKAERARVERNKVHLSETMKVESRSSNAGFELWKTENKADIKANFPTLTPAKFLVKCMELWKELDDKERKEWDEAAVMYEGLH